MRNERLRVTTSYVSCADCNRAVTGYISHEDWTLTCHN